MMPGPSNTVTLCAERLDGAEGGDSKGMQPLPSHGRRGMRVRTLVPPLSPDTAIESSLQTRSIRHVHTHQLHRYGEVICRFAGVSGRGRCGTRVRAIAMISSHHFRGTEPFPLGRAIRRSCYTEISCTCL